ncbi:ABC-2 transporter permease [Clostridioides sp. ZZV15-6597]|uniref:ABC-2 transporter permease n=1 Tax=Clostridioides sp. ZZV15-6597 TaxID=2811500 RepID=UPI001D10627D|nr:ABC-2 transporter permease [Clostridioides sp. ZZV15-6597]
MKGLLLKDYYIIKSSIITLLITFAVIGFGVSFFATPQVLIVIATTVLGMSVATIINIDKKCGWLKTAVTFPTPKRTIISSKYLMYVLLCLLGIVFGIIFSTMVSFVINDMNFSFLPLFTCLSIVMTFFSGGIMLPCFYLLDEEKSVVGAIIAYPLAAGFVFGMSKLIDNGTLSMAISILVSIIIFIISWCLICKHVSTKDI